MSSLRKKLCIIVVAIAGCLAAIGLFVGCEKTPQTVPYHADVYTVTFDAGRGTIFGGRYYFTTVEKDDYVARPSKEPIREGYIFWGWNTTGDQSDPLWYFDFDKMTADTTLKAVWVEELTITFYAGIGTFENGTNRYTTTVAMGDKLIAPNVIPPDENTKLLGWNGIGKRWDFNQDRATHDVLLDAVWSLKNDILIALEPFKYSITDDGYHIEGVVDANVSGTLTVPSVVTSISKGALAGCNNIVSVNISDSVTEIGQNAFQNCEKLKSVTLPSGLTKIEPYTFNGCKALEQVRMPDELTEIGYYAFNGCSSLKSIKLDGITKVPSSTFYGCSSLQEATLGDNVTAIERYAFYGCSALNSFKLPSGIEQLGERAFAGCSSLKSVTVPATCTKIETHAFDGCTELTRATLHCATIDPYAFYGCKALSSVTLGDEVRTIGLSAFYGSGLTAIDIPDTVTAIDSSFYNCAALRSVTIGNGVKEIPNSAFGRCYALRNITIGSGVKEIKGMAFYDCDSLLSITIPAGVQTIAESAFSNCSRLLEVYNLSDTKFDTSYISSPVKVYTDASEESIIHKTDDGFSFGVGVYSHDNRPYLLDYWGDGADVVLPDSYNGDSYKIYNYALSYNPKLRSVKLSAGVNDIGSEILLGSDNVTSLTVDSSNTVYSSADNCIISTAAKKFVLGCKTSAIPTDGSVTSIGSNVFCHSTTITRLRIPDSVTKVDVYAFQGNDGIISIADNGVRYVDKWAYSFVSSSSEELVDIELAAGTVGICERAFSDNSPYAANKALRSVKFNAELKYVGALAFRGCTNLTDMIMNDGLLHFGYSVFLGCSSLQEVVIPDSVQTMDTSVFSGCTNLKYVKLSAGLAEIDGDFFRGCSALESVVVRQSVTYFAYSSFSGCPETVKIYYEGSEEQWSEIHISSNDNSVLNNATKYYYSETEIEGVNCWHYDVDGKPTTEY